MSTATLTLPGFGPVTAPRPTDERPVAPRRLEVGNHAHPISLISPRGWPSGEVVALLGPDGEKGRGPRATLMMFGTKDRRTFPISDLRRHALPHEIIEDWFAEKDPIIVIPCGYRKLDHAAPAGDMYVGGHHRLARQAADRLALNHGGRVVILSAKHGLLDLDTVIEPYDVTVGDWDAVDKDYVTRQLIAMDARNIIALTPKSYTALLTGRSGSRVDDRLAGTTSIFEQRTVLATIKNGSDLR
jgi:hypothetical protein